jgi:hypothetical protein
VSAALTPPVQAGTSPSGFDFGNGAVRVYFVAAADGRIHELSYNPSNGWAVGAALTPAVRAGSSPIGLDFGGGGSTTWRPTTPRSMS